MAVGRNSHTQEICSAKPINEILQRKKHHTLQKYLVLNHSDFIYKQKEPKKEQRAYKISVLSYAI